MKLNCWTGLASLANLVRPSLASLPWYSQLIEITRNYYGLLLYCVFVCSYTMWLLVEMNWVLLLSWRTLKCLGTTWWQLCWFTSHQSNPLYQSDRNNDDIITGMPSDQQMLSTLLLSYRGGENNAGQCRAHKNYRGTLKIIGKCGVVTAGCLYMTLCSRAWTINWTSPLIN